MKKIISVILVTVFSLELFSCDFLEKVDNSGDICNHHSNNFYPEGYTCGFPSIMRQPMNLLEFWWVETYDECMEAIELLKSHDSTFRKTAIFTYDGELFDTKYCFKISHNNKYTEYINFGDNPFDRKACDVEVHSYAFFEEVTIDEINYGDIDDYGVNSVIWLYTEELKESMEINPKYLEYEWNADYTDFFVNDKMKDKRILRLSSFGYNDDPVKAEKCVQAIINSLELIGFDD